MSAEGLAKLAQNPVANLISVPFQNNTNFNYGPLDGTQNILNIQPVVPVTLRVQGSSCSRSNGSARLRDSFGTRRRTRVGSPFAINHGQTQFIAGEHR